MAFKISFICPHCLPVVASIWQLLSWAKKCGGDPVLTFATYSVRRKHRGRIAQRAALSQLSERLPIRTNNISIYLSVARCATQPCLFAKEAGKWNLVTRQILLLRKEGRTDMKAFSSSPDIKMESGDFTASIIEALRRFQWRKQAALWQAQSEREVDTC